MSSPEPDEAHGRHRVTDEDQRAEDAGKAHPGNRGIRSYVLRRSHFSVAQRDAYARLMPRYGVAFDEAPLDYDRLFGRSAPTILEIGFGMGDTTADIAANHPDWNFLGIEVHTPGVGALLKTMEQRGLHNIRVIEHDAQAVLEYQIPDESLTGVHIFFPDPWPKARHHKRRLIQQHLVTRLYRALRPGGYLHFATDWPDYAEQMLAVVDATPGLVALARSRGGSGESAGGPSSGLTPGPAAIAPLVTPADRPVTKFERRGLRLGHPIADIVRFKGVGAFATN